MSALAELAAELRAEGGLLAGVTRDPAPGTDFAAGHEPAYAFVLEAIREGHELHYGRPRILDDADADLGLLAGDRLYALGLARLAALGDTHAVAVMAELIAAAAAAHAEDRPADADAAWAEGARLVAREAKTARPEPPAGTPGPSDR